MSRLDLWEDWISAMEDGTHMIIRSLIKMDFGKGPILTTNAKEVSRSRESIGRVISTGKTSQECHGTILLSKSKGQSWLICRGISFNIGTLRFMTCPTIPKTTWIISKTDTMNWSNLRKKNGKSWRKQNLITRHKDKSFSLIVDQINHKCSLSSMCTPK